MSKDSIDFEQTADLVKFGAEKSKIMIATSIFIAFSIFLTGHAIYSIYFHWTDESIPLVSCPKSFENDSPVLMEPIQQTDSVFNQDRWIRGFVRKVVLNAYPRTKDDAYEFFKFMRDVSEGSVRHKYETFLADIEQIGMTIEAGNMIRFYPKDSNKIRIRSERVGRWVIEVDGYFVKSMGSSESRTNPTLRFVIEARSATRTNPNGLVVVEMDKEQIADYVSGKREIEEKTDEK